MQALRVGAMAVVRERILRHVGLRQLGRDRRVCKDWHRWNAEAMAARVPVIPTYVVAGVCIGGQATPRTSHSIVSLLPNQ